MDADLLAAHAASALARGILTLPVPVQRALAGRVPPEAEGIDPGAHLLARVAALADRATEKRPEAPVEVSRKLADAQSRFLSRRPRRPVRTSDESADGVPVRFYEPVDALPDALLVFFHGGGWVNRTVDSHDPAVRVLADLSGVRVASVEYRRAPEHPFPAAADDACVAYSSLCGRSSDTRVAVGGDSAGGNLAASVCVSAARGDVPMPAFQWLLYPATDASTTYRSTRTYSTGWFLTQAAMDRYEALYMEGHQSDPRASPLLAPDLSAFPPAYVATAQTDPLRDEGELYATRLREAGVPAISQRFPLLHGFFNTTVHRAARDAVAVTAGALRAGLA